MGEGVFFEPNNFATEFLNTLQEEIELIAIAYDGRSQNVQCITYENYTGKQPKYRENYELLNDLSMDILGSYPDYKIYKAK